MNISRLAVLALAAMCLTAGASPALAAAPAKPAIKTGTVDFRAFDAYKPALKVGQKRTYSETVDYGTSKKTTQWVWTVSSLSGDTVVFKRTKNGKPTMERQSNVSGLTLPGEFAEHFFRRDVTYTIVGAEDVKVGGKTYKGAVKSVSKGGDTTITAWMVPGVGFVKAVKVSPDVFTKKPQTTVKELVSIQ